MKKTSTWWVGAIALLTLTVACLWDYYPPLPGSQELTVVFDAPRAGSREPLIVTGRVHAGDFLYVRYVDEHTAIIGYDCWGVGGPESAPVPIVPGRRHSLHVELPSLGFVPASAVAPPRRLRVTVDGRTALDAVVDSWIRRPQRLWFGRNPLGGTASGPEFHGRIFGADGRLLAGSPRTFMTRGERIRGWFYYGRWQVFAVLLASGALAWTWSRAGDRLGRANRSRAPTWPARVFHTDVAPVARFAPTSRRGGRGSGSPSAHNVQPERRMWEPGAALRVHRAFIMTAALCTVAFAAMVSWGTFRLIYPESLGSFYDYQALSLMQGRLDVPPEAILSEAFIRDGKTYGYFGPTPALLRLPLVIFGVAFGELTRIAMLVYYVACLIAAYLLLGEATALIRPERPRPSTWATVFFTAHVGLGSTLYFLGSRAHLYHEAILSGLPFALFSAWCSFRHLATPPGRWWLGALICGLLAVQARPPAGLFALTLLGGVAVLHAGRSLLAGDWVWLRHPFAVLAAICDWKPQPRSDHRLQAGSYKKHLAVVALSFVAVLSFNGLGYLKFRSFEGAPLRYHVVYTPARLASFGNRNFHVSNLPHGLHTYVVRPNFRFERRFPWLYLRAETPARPFPAAKLDVRDHTLALPYAMPGLFALALAASLWAAVAFRAARAPVAATWAAGLPVVLAMFAASSVAHRYTADFLPFLLCAAAFGLAAVDNAARPWRGLIASALTAAALWAMALTLAITLHHQRESDWGLPTEVKQSYQQLRARVDALFGIDQRR